VCVCLCLCLCLCLHLCLCLPRFLQVTERQLEVQRTLDFAAMYVYVHTYIDIHVYMYIMYICIYLSVPPRSAVVRVSVYHSVLQRVAVYCCVLQYAAVNCRKPLTLLPSPLRTTGISLLQCVAVSCSVLHGFAVCRSVSQYIALCCNALQCSCLQNSLSPAFRMYSKFQKGIQVKHAAPSRLIFPLIATSCGTRLATISNLHQMSCISCNIHINLYMIDR